MADRPRFSVVIAAYNASRTLPSTVRSVLAQTRQNFEIVIVDDGSVDGTEAVIRWVTRDRRVIYARQGNNGPAAARNAGIDRARGRYISFLDSDDLWLPQYLESMEDTLVADRQAAMAYTDAWRLDDETRKIYRGTIMASPDLPPPDPRTFLRALLQRNFVYSSATIRRSALAEVGGFRSTTRSEDYELWLRIAAHGKRIARAPGILAIYRDHRDSRSTDALAMLRGRCEIYSLVVDTYDVPPDIRELARARLHATQHELAALEDRLPDQRGWSWRSSAPANLLRNQRLFRRRPPVAVSSAFPDLRLV